MILSFRYIEVFRSNLSEIKPILFRGGPGGRPGPYDRPGERDFDAFGRGERFGSGYERQYRGRGRGGRGGGAGGGYMPYDPYAAAGFYDAAAAVSEYYRPEPTYDESAAYNNALAAQQSMVTYPPIRPSQPGKAPTSVVTNPQLKFMIRMRGLPFSAKDRDIETFFAPLVPTKINIDFDHYGRPSGEAEVFFGSHKDAVAAMSKNNAHMGVFLGNLVLLTCHHFVIFVLPCCRSSLH